MVPTPVAVSELMIIFRPILSFDLPNKIFLVLLYTLSMRNEVTKFTIGNQMSGQFQPYHKHCCPTVHVYSYGRKVFMVRINMRTDEESAYQSYGVNCTEIEVDVLTGEVEVVRSDILFDCGQRLV